MADDGNFYLVSLFSFKDDTDLQDFYEYCDTTMQILSKQSGFISAYGYLSTYEMARYRYVGITELASLDALYGVVDTEEEGQKARLTPPETTSVMTIFASRRWNTYSDDSGPHQNHTEDSVMFINPFSISVDERASRSFEELIGRNQMTQRAAAGHVGYQGFYSTNPSSIHNYVSLAEWESENAFYAYMESDALKAAVRGSIEIATSGFPGLYRLMLAQNSRGYRIDNRYRAAS